MPACLTSRRTVALSSLLVFPEHAPIPLPVRAFACWTLAGFNPPLLDGLMSEDMPVGSPPIARFTWEPKFLGTGSATIYVVAIN